MSTLHGKIPFEDDADNDTKAASEKLRRVKLTGIITFHYIGTGKTILGLEILLGCNKPCAYMSKDKMPVYKPIFLISPQNLIRPWAREIKRYWSISELIISYDDGAMEPLLAEHVVTATAVRSWPNKKIWPKKCHYILNRQVAHNARSIFLTAPETHAERSLIKEEIPHAAVSFDPPRFDDDNVEIYQRKAYTEIKYRSRFEGCCSVLLVDEGMKIKTVGTGRHTAADAL